MSVVTSADEAIDRAKYNIEQAVNNLSEVVIGKTWGHDDYTDARRKELRKILFELLEIHERI